LNKTFPKDFIEGNPQIFLNFDWINVPKLKMFIEGEDFYRREFSAIFGN